MSARFPGNGIGTRLRYVSQGFVSRDNDKHFERYNATFLNHLTTGNSLTYDIVQTKILYLLGKV